MIEKICMEKWGIWGLGLVGKSVIRHVSLKGYTLSVFDDRCFTDEEIDFLQRFDVKIYSPKKRYAFFSDNDVIVPSPGIERRSAVQFQHKMVEEVDLFFETWKKKVVAVTGSLGKTTLVNFIEQVVTANAIKGLAVGNSGIPMLDVLPRQNTLDCAVLELSSFQLEHAHYCAPDVAVWTNLYPNHLDRHKTIDEYFKAKYKIIQGQRIGQKTLVPLALGSRICRDSDRPLCFFSTLFPTRNEVASLGKEDVLYTYDQKDIVKITYNNGGIIQKKTRLIVSSENTERCSGILPETWLLLVATCDLLGLIAPNGLVIPPLKTQSYRMELLGTRAGTLFYNDSKSTLLEATIMAAQTLSPRPVHLLLGGLSKGVNRSHKIAYLKNLVSTVVCFGSEAELLHEMCTKEGIISSAHTTLDDALTFCLQNANPGDAVLFSPGGTSFDLYKNFEERGNHFNYLFRNLPAKQESLS